MFEVMRVQSISKLTHLVRAIVMQKYVRIPREINNHEGQPLQRDQKKAR